MYAIYEHVLYYTNVSHINDTMRSTNVDKNNYDEKSFNKKSDGILGLERMLRFIKYAN